MSRASRVAQASCLCLRNHRQDACATSRPGFTLVELLIVMAIIAILVSMAFGAVFVAQETARRDRSEGMIGKLHNVVIDRWESYRTRRMIISSAIPNPTPWQRLQARRELMRIEMPDRYEDLVFSPQYVATPVGLRATYVRRINAARQKYNTQVPAPPTTYPNANAFITGKLSDGNNQHESAECLYLFITASMSADERAEFKDKEVADTNNNFMPEFIDAWGMPIHFLRWAPGFVSDVHVQDPIDHHDPFDPYGAQIGYASTPNNISKRPPTPGDSSEPQPEPAPFTTNGIQVWGFAMLPLIYSAGPDREYGIHEFLYAAVVPAAPTSNRSLRNEDPYARYYDGTAYLWRGEGALNADLDTVHFDNVHNHNSVGVR